MTVVDKLVSDLNGKYWVVTGPDRYQCTAIPHELERRLGLPIVYGDAKDTFNNAPYPKFTAGWPLKGDVLVFRPNGGNGFAGHTSVYLQAQESFDQNYPTGSRCHIQGHAGDWFELIGWFRLPGVNSGGGGPVDDATWLALPQTKNIAEQLVKARNHNAVARYLLYVAEQPTSQEAAGAVQLDPETVTYNLCHDPRYAALWKSIGLSDADIQARIKAQDPFLPAFYASRKNLPLADAATVAKINKARQDLENIDVNVNQIIKDLQ